MKLIESIDIQPHNTKWLNNLENEGLLVVDNSFQRKYVWTENSQIKLIESILLGYPVPEIYLWNTGTDEDTGDTKYSIIDGQQRCGAIFQYISNTFKLKASALDSEAEGFYTRRDRFFKDLETIDKKAIWSYVFSIRIVRNEVSRNDIVNMFLRLNSNNMTLNPQELRNAEFEGEFMKVAAELSELPFWTENSLFSLADRRRMRDVAFVSILLVFMKEGIQEDINNLNLNKIYDLYNDEYPTKNEDISKFKSIILTINSIIDGNSEREKVLKRQVHFYTLFTVVYDIYINQKHLTDVQKDSYRRFIDNYDNEELLKQYFPEIIEEVYRYKALSKEGTRQKGNRIERHKILKDIFNYRN